MSTKVTINVSDNIYSYWKRQAHKYFNGEVSGYLADITEKDKEKNQGRSVSVYDGNVLGYIDATLVKKLKEKDDREYWLVDTGIGYQLKRWISK
ncbi:hypothetical protein OW763_13215 [Clostridium aestuarii]|uniref:HIRAN domain-containing protein n=1 Tax=Clostridium aestuarii TaxID=338193 RepID=A0ABT4D214_9CLOT|nr:hypothetical protein [Clostridium aestuarii]MCY6485293.1 hypothetical protein [Clostridium aestuarii]